MTWYPLSKRTDPNAQQEYEALHDGVPAWLSEPIRSWVADAFGAFYSYDSNHPPIEVLDVVYGMLRRPMPTSHDRERIAIAQLADDAAAGDLDALDVALWSTCLHREGRDLRERLDLLLRVHGSSWKVADDEASPHLERRIDETVSAIGRAEMVEIGNHALYLRAAWSKVYGRSPDPSGAYREAVRAVEAAAKPIISPNDTTATLGKMIAAVRDKPGNWKVALGSSASSTGSGLVVEMCGALWRSQQDRHGTDDTDVATHVSMEQAEAALHLAVMLVHWFRSGLVVRALDGSGA